MTKINARIIWTASSEFGTYRICEQRRFRRACAFAQSRQNLRCSLIKAVSQEEPSDRKPDPWPLWMSGHAQLKFVMTECSTQIRLAGPISKPHAHLQTMEKTCAKFQKDQYKIVWGIALTRYPLSKHWGRKMTQYTKWKKWQKII